jgi:hypothetical protein
MAEKREIGVIAGEFFTDGNTFVFQLAGTPLSGTGSTPSAAFEDLLRVESTAGPLSKTLKDLGRDQQGEQVRATVIRMSMIGLIVFGVIAGTLAATAAMLPRVAGDMSQIAASRLETWLVQLPPSSEERIGRFFQRVGGLMRSPDANCPAPSTLAPAAPK